MGFLSNLLPVIAGGALASTGIGAPAAAAMLGGLQYARTGSLQKGLMAGLGAYGGAGLASGLAGAGASAMNTTAAQATQAANPELLASEIGREMGQAGFMQPEIAANMNPAAATMTDKMGLGATNLGTKAGMSNFANQMGGNSGLLKTGLAAAAPMLLQSGNQQPQTPTNDNAMPQRLQYNAGAVSPMPAPDVPGYDNLGQDFGRMQNYYPNAGYQNITPEQAKLMRGYAAGGMMAAAGGGPVELMSDQAAIGANTGYPMSSMTTSSFATPYQDPKSTSVIAPSGGAAVNQMTGELNPQGTRMATGGLSSAASHLGGYSDGGRLLRGPGDGVSDSIPAVIGNKRPARLADGEFVVPARIVSELGNGSTEAGARKLYAMLDRVQAARKKSIGKGKVAKNSRADKFLPA